MNKKDFKNRVCKHCGKNPKDFVRPKGIPLEFHQYGVGAYNRYESLENLDYLEQLYENSLSH